MPRFDLIDPRRLWVSYILALTLLFSLITFSHFAGILFGGDVARAASDINISGRQRMLSQRILYFGQKHTGADYRDANAEQALREAHALFLTSHDTLVSEVERPLSPASHGIYFADDGPRLDDMSRRFIEDTGHVLDGPIAERSDAYKRMAEIGSDGLLFNLNTAVTTFEDEAKRLDRVGDTWGYIGYGLAIFALFLEGVFIFRPAHRTIVQAVEDLEENNVQLKQQEAEAFAALEDAEDAWAEAEMSRKTSDELVGYTRTGVQKLRDELSVPIGATEQSIVSFGTGEFTPEQRQKLIDISRLNAVVRAALNGFATQIENDSLPPMEQECPFCPVELAKTAVVAVRHLTDQSEQTIEIDYDDDGVRKIAGPPVTTLRLMLGVIGQVAKSSGIKHVRVRLCTEPGEKGVVVALEVIGSPATGEPPVEVVIDERSCLSELLQDALGATIGFEQHDDGSVQVRTIWQAKTATVRAARKPGRLRRPA
ncbi:type IV pili methyl-accepting chemotaxis transducer N-terminal domain-containing protein [Actibacterium sp. 188UL27-1]|uniref:type IV pili methyl-accepting chemotaxis transducer N-terminal domain-containing protein n=1 Tax=Actibacterium sp. 188UL27-1 TaxID=2786961 RepID=UPI00195E9022|nr:type IV pili methyl-accepting chemotaxis transducer N-terminal domain-containing protein [Actibacterium sp. 188UL27-1]MBM7068659.1 type IV pili methyl-accepting chemotaxis transducer N-terminal domain-containing protein [Actibacterium sp. 188UL27-1]